MRNKGFIVATLIVMLITVLGTGCKKEKLLTSGGQLRYSTDTLTFDTVFTAQGSFTTQVKLYNPQNQKVNINAIRLEKGSASYFKLNVNGISGNSVTDIELAANDSMYIFATVNIDPTVANTPFVVEDKLIATLNGKDYELPFMAYGQNAYYITDSLLETSQTWKTDKPYVIIHSAQVKENTTLTIPAGCRIYMHADSRLYVDGTLVVNGTKKDSVIFQGDRLDRKYFGNEGYPGEWGGLYFSPKSRKSVLNYAILRNCGSTTGIGLAAAIWATPDSVNDNDFQLRMYSTIIENSIGYGIVGFGSTIYGQNCLVHNCGAQGLATFEGGQYYFDNCNFVTYGNKKISHIDNPTVALINYRDIDDYNYVAGPLDAQLRNCVIWGSLETECFINKKGNSTVDVKLINCAIRSSEQIPSYVTSTNNIINTDPSFKDANGGDFRLNENSPLKDKGISISGLDRDLDDKPRTGVPDIGCYEY